jgi:four helix bundle suffix protein
MIIVLIHQADVLIRSYYDWQYNKFLEEGGYREKLARERLVHRKDR